MKNKLTFKLTNIQNRLIVKLYNSIKYEFSIFLIMQDEENLKNKFHSLE